MKTLVDEIIEAIVDADPAEFASKERRNWFADVLTPVVLKHEQASITGRLSEQHLKQWVEVEQRAMEFLRVQFWRLQDVIAGFEQRGMTSSARETRQIRGEVESSFMAHKIALQNMQTICKPYDFDDFEIALSIRNTLPTPHRLNEVLKNEVTVPPAFEGTANAH